MEYLGRTDFVHLKPENLEAKDRQEDVVVKAAAQPTPQSVGAAAAKSGKAETVSEALAELMGDAPLCDQCGHVTVRNGACYKCINCGNSMGCS
jgi:ribonucleoside-diphosphate reductase alpha chain